MPLITHRRLLGQSYDRYVVPPVSVRHNLLFYSRILLARVLGAPFGIRYSAAGVVGLFPIIDPRCTWRGAN